MSNAPAMDDARLAELARLLGWDMARVKALITDGTEARVKTASAWGLRFKGETTMNGADFLDGVDAYTEALEEFAEVDPEGARLALKAAVDALAAQVGQTGKRMKAQQVAHLSPADAIARLMNMA